MQRGSKEARQFDESPGWFNAVCVGFLTALAVFCALNYWPIAGRISVILNFCISLVVSVLFFGAFTLWVVKSNRLYRTTAISKWPRRVAVVPATIIAGLALVLVAQGPSFERYQYEFEAAVSALPDGPIYIRDVSIGAFDIQSIQRREGDDTVYFSDADRVFFSRSGGWVYSPDHVPQADGGDRLEVDHIDGPWYKFSLVSHF